MLRALLGSLLALAVSSSSAALAADAYGNPHRPGGFGTDHQSDVFGGHFGRDRGRLPLCDEPRVLDRIVQKWAYADDHLHYTGQQITLIAGIHQHAEKPGTPGFIDRRFCGATATLTDGRQSEVVYLIEANQGFASHGYNVESCFPKYDPLRVYGKWCRSLRP